MSKANNLSADQIERLALLAEELAETVHIVSKILLYGMDSHHPTTGELNRSRLEEELGDVLFTIDLMIANGEVSSHNIYTNSKLKAESIKKYLHYDHSFPVEET